MSIQPLPFHIARHAPPARPGARSRAATATLALAAALAAPASLAQLSLGASLAGGQLGYQIESDTGRLWKGSSPMATVSADVALPGGFYVGLSHTGASGGEVDFSFRGLAGASNIGLKRSDTALTFGYALANRLNGFIGVKSASTALDNGFGTEFKTSGYFAGVAYPIAMGPTYLALSLAVGSNSGTWQDRTGSVKDAAFGYSGGARFTYAFSRSLSAGVGAKYQRYEYLFENAGLGTLSESLRMGELFLNASF